MNGIEDNLYITFTMDCERIKKFSPPGGPESWEISERAIRGYSKILLEYNMKCTFFIVPETALKHRDIFHETLDYGFELGMHYHPQSFLDGRYTKYLGEYSYEEQLSQLTQALEYWRSSIGFRPYSFRPGNASSNEYTYKVLFELGFRQTSTYIPQRNIPKYHAVYLDANPYPHHVNNMDIFEVPMTSDIRIRPPVNKDPPHLRIEWGNVDILKEIVDFWIGHLIKKKIPVKSIVIITHNFIDYSNESLEYTIRLRRLIRYILERAKDYNLNPVPITIEELHRLVDEMEINV